MTTVRYRMEQDMPLPHLGDNLEEVTIAVNNTDGTVPFVSQASTELGIFPCNLGQLYRVTMVVRDYVLLISIWLLHCLPYSA